MAFANTKIKSIQRGTVSMAAIDTTQTATLSPAVNTALTELRLLGQSVVSGTGADSGVRATLTNGTTITFTKLGASGGAVVVSWEATERYG